MRRSLTTTGIGVVLIPLMLGVASAPAIAADSGDVAVTDTETVQARLSASGDLITARVYDQLALSGHGTATISNPVSTKGLRNLDGFGGYQVVDGNLVSHVTVDGTKRQRSVSTYDKDLPLTVKVTYTLDGKPVEAGAVVGRTGTLGVHYTVKNVTGRTEDVTYDDGTGTMQTASEQTVVPMIGQLVTTLPAGFTDVQSDEAGIAGDGHGGSRLTFQMTLFPPIGSDTAEFGYTAHVSRGLVPPANLTSMPVSPLDYPSFKGGSASYEAGAQKGVDLTAGAIQIDDSVLKLHDGSAQLLAGLLQLREGANQLSDGLNNDAAPGALALAVGAKKLDAGLAEARSKAPQLIDGLTQVDGGLALVDAGLAKMYGDIGGLPAQAQQIHDGIAQMRAGIGTTANPATLLGGVDMLRRQVGTDAPAALATMAAGIYNTDPAAPGAYQQLSCAIAVLTDVKSGAAALGAGIHPCYPGGRPSMAASDPTNAAVLGQLITSLGLSLPKFADPAHLGDASSPAFYGAPASTSANLQQGLTYLQGRLAHVAGPGLTSIECGLSNVSITGCDASKPGLLEGINGVDEGVSLLVTKVVTSVQKGVGDGNDTKADGTLRGGIHSLQSGTDQLSAGGDALASGLGQLGTGAHQLSSGAGQLSDGLTDAADGSTQLSDGLTTAADGAPALVDGTQQLSDEGSSQVVVSGQETAKDFGVKYAVLTVGAERASAEGMAYGAPEGAAGATAYSIDIAGADGSSVHTIGRLILAIVLFAAGIGAATLVRRRIA